MIASLGGVALGGLLNVLADTLRWRREDRRADVARAGERRERTQQLFVDFATLGDELVSRLSNFVDFQDTNPDGWRTDPFVQDQIDKLETAWSSFNRTYNALRIAGMGPSMRQAGAARVQAATENLYGFLSEAFVSAYPPKTEGPREEYGDIAQRFLDRVAAEMGPMKPRRQLAQRPSRPRRQIAPRA